MHYSYPGGRRKDMPFHLDPPKKCFTPTLGVNTKIFLIGYPPNKCSKFLLLSLKSFVTEKRHGAMQKLFIKKEKSKKRRIKKKKEMKKKWTSVRDI